MLMYGFDNSGVLNIDIPDGVLFNLTSMKEGFVTLPLLIPPNNIGRFTDRDFDIAYAQYVMNNDNVFCQFFQIIYNLYIGKDVFILERRIDGEKGGVVIPYDADASDEQINNVTCSSQSSEKINGYGCAEKIRRAGWKIDNSYPWK